MANYLSDYDEEEEQEVAGKEELDGEDRTILAPAPFFLFYPPSSQRAPGRLGLCLGPVCAGRPRQLCSALVCAKAGFVPDAQLNVLKRRSKRPQSRQ